MTTTLGPDRISSDGGHAGEDMAPRHRGDDIAAAFFSTWVVVGLFVDGWAHNAGKPETFWTPWHAVLYSGFLAGAGWFAVVQLARARRGEPLVPSDPLALAGFALFGLGGAGDMAWHTVFGVEEDVEALLSPTHLALMTAGLLLVSAPVRSALAEGDRPATSRRFAPAAIGIALTTAIVAFFLQFASALRIADRDVYAARIGDERETAGIVAILLTNALLCGTVLWVRRHWPRPPFGTFTLVFAVTATLMAGLNGFDELALAAPVAVAGLVGDALVSRHIGERTLAVALPVVIWAGWFATYHAAFGLGWSPELWTGTIALTALTGFGLHLLGTDRPSDEVGDPVRTVASA